MIRLAPEIGRQPQPRICVIGVGGGGGNAVANMIANDVRGVDFIAANTDAQALNVSPAECRIQLGRVVTGGLGAGATAAIGKAAAEESIDAVERAIDGADMCFIAAGLGGGTGTGGAPVIAEAARAKGMLTVGVVTLPFEFEGRRRAAVAAAGLHDLAPHVDTLIVVPNQNLFRIAGPDMRMGEAFCLADKVLEQGVRSITDLIYAPGIVNLDLADVREVMRARGRALLGTGEATGQFRAAKAAELALTNPLLEGAIDGASGLIISITGGYDLRLMEIDEVAGYIKGRVDPDADIIWGSSLDEKLDGCLRVSVIVTGIDERIHEASREGMDCSRRWEPPLLLVDRIPDVPAQAPIMFSGEEDSFTDDLVEDSDEASFAGQGEPGAMLPGRTDSGGRPPLFQRMARMARGLPTDVKSFAEIDSDNGRSARSER
jgi:cell division protein FtsZ